MSTRGSRRRIDVACTVAVEHSAERLLAEVDLAGVVVGAGDEVLVHGLPDGVGTPGRIRCHRRATIRRAGPLGRLHAHLAGYLLLTELYEIGFSVGRTR